MHFKTLASAALAVTAVSAQAMNETMNLTSLIGSNTNLSGLGTLLSSYPSIAGAVANMTNITLFAPSNEAINALQQSGALSPSTPDLAGVIQAVLSYHIVGGEIYASNITSTPAFVPTMQNNATYSNVTGGQRVEARLVDNTTVELTSGLKMMSNVTQANLNFTGGVVHIIDRVLTIPTNFSATAEVANLTACLGAATATNLTSTLDTARDITIFAPSNSAFQAIGSANLSASELAGILEYHVINGTVAYSSSLTNASITALNGGKLNVTVEPSGAVFVNSARVVVPDILISGGVLHVIDSVLNPNSTNSTANPSETIPANAYSGVASSASDVPFTSGIPAPSSTNAALASTVTNVASGYSSVAPAAGASASGGAAGAGASSSSKAAAAALAGPTGVIGAAALFGGAAYMAGQF